MCTLHVWKYRWEPVTVSVSRWARDAKRRTACESSSAGGPVAAEAIAPEPAGRAPEGEAERPATRK